MEYYAIAFCYKKPSYRKLYFSKDPDTKYAAHLTKNMLSTEGGVSNIFSVNQLSSLILWIEQQPRVMLMLNVITSAGKLAHAKDINKYIRGNTLLTIQRYVFLHQFRKAWELIPKKYHISVVSAIKKNSIPVKDNKNN